MFNTTAKLVQEKYFNEWNIKINPFTDPCFKAARDARDATRRKLQTLPGKRTVNSAALTENEFLNMVQILNENTPDGLQKKFFLIASFELAWRGGEGASCFTYYFKPEIDNKGLIIGRIEYNPVFSKTAQGGSKPLTSSKWLTKNKDNPNLCPVRLYHLLMMKRGNNINTDRMFLTPNPFWNKIQNAVWYKNSPVGVNEIGKWVKSLAIVTGLDIKRRKISNHSVRSSAVSALAKAGVEEQQLMKITGHQNVNSIKPYLQLDDEHHKSIINKIRNNSVNQVNNTVNDKTISGASCLFQNCSDPNSQKNTLNHVFSTTNFLSGPAGFVARCTIYFRPFQEKLLSPNTTATPSTRSDGPAVTRSVLSIASVYRLNSDGIRDGGTLRMDHPRNGKEREPDLPIMPCTTGRQQQTNSKIVGGGFPLGCFLLFGINIVVLAFDAYMLEIQL
ncbi:hypothetical protein Zmor_014660 [Zophobas morio]|uniref:ZMYM2-like/QRICH1 C-terminal domain-containing protein n=1 Tax=Zophobas morio TaxID=2755281 RepID=A0AA38II04_9CUCU|nr:hypothetical protein Zmor_014660 [Zophobas morio]